MKSAACFILAALLACSGPTTGGNDGGADGAGPECTLGQTQCDGDALETCDASGHFVETQACADGCCKGTCGTGFAAFTGAPPADWTANGIATYDATTHAAQLTDLTPQQAGSWIYDRAVFVDDVTFQFDFSAGGGTGADGVAFMLETDGANVVGAHGGGLGVGGLHGFGVEFDSFDDAECGEPNGNHVGIDSLAPCGAGAPTSLVVNDTPGFTIADGAWHTVTIHVTGGAFTVTADAIAQFSAYAPAGWANAKYYVGFGGATGGQTNVHEIRNVSVSFTTPHCY